MLLVLPATPPQAGPSVGPHKNPHGFSEISARQALFVSLVLILLIGCRPEHMHTSHVRSCSAIWPNTPSLRPRRGPRAGLPFFKSRSPCSVHCACIVGSGRGLCLHLERP